MKLRRFSRFVSSLVLLAAALSAGCEAGFVGDAARSSLASFLSNVLTTAVNETVNP